MKARDPIGFRSLWSEYSNRYPQSARIAVNQDAFRQMGGEGALEQGLRQSSEYQRYMQGMKAAGAEQFMLTPQSFAAQDVQGRRKGQDVMAEFYKGRGTGEPVGDMSPDQPFKKQVGDKMVKVPVGPKGELLLDKAGQPATKFRSLPQSEVDRLKMQEMRRQEDVKLQEMQPRVAELEGRLGRTEKVEYGLAEADRVIAEIQGFSKMLEGDPIMSQPDYASKIKQGQDLIRGGGSAADAYRLVKGAGGMAGVQQERAMSLIERRGQIAADLKRMGLDYNQRAAEDARDERERIRQLSMQGNISRFNLEKSRAASSVLKDIGARERAILEYEREGGKDSDISLIQEEVNGLRRELELIESLEFGKSSEASPAYQPTYQPPVQQPEPAQVGGPVVFTYQGKEYTVTQDEWNQMPSAQKSSVSRIR